MFAMNKNYMLATFAVYGRPLKILLPFHVFTMSNVGHRFERFSLSLMMFHDFRDFSFQFQFQLFLNYEILRFVQAIQIADI